VAWLVFDCSSDPPLICSFAHLVSFGEISSVNMRYILRALTTDGACPLRLGKWRTALINLRLATTDTRRAMAIRDHVLPLLRQHGTVEVQRDVVRLTELRIRAWVFCFWTPFNELGRDEASSPGYRHAIEKQRSRKSLPYGLDISLASARIFRILWSDDGTVDVASFVRGQWEDEVLRL
jgi:hypothetical protein